MNINSKSFELDAVIKHYFRSGNFDQEFVPPLEKD